MPYSIQVRLEQVLFYSIRDTHFNHSELSHIGKIRKIKYNVENSC